MEYIHGHNIYKILFPNNDQILDNSELINLLLDPNEEIAIL